MQSELHERLEYLVNYSSQLIFVSGDSAAQQKKTLESFVFQQHDETEIAYVTADPTMELSDYRRQLCRQLLGTLVGSYTRPLNELLAGLNEHVGPILITITQAEHVPDALLQELWDLVLQSRFAGNKQHLNVLLFGESSWAESAKKWLPAKNTDTPLLISSQSVAAQQPGSELDTMIENRRKAFHEHLANRDGYQSHRETKSTSALTSPLFVSLVAVMFVAVFGGLVYWQYGDDINALFAPIEEQQPPQANVEPGSAFDQLKDTKAELEGNNNAGDQPVASWDKAVAAIDDDSQAAADVEETSQPEDLLSFIEDVTAEKTSETRNEPQPESPSSSDTQAEDANAEDVTPETKAMIASNTDLANHEKAMKSAASSQESAPTEPAMLENKRNASSDALIAGSAQQDETRTTTQTPLVTEEKVGRKPMVLESRPKGQVASSEPARNKTPSRVEYQPPVQEASQSATSVPSESPVSNDSIPVFTGSGDYDNQQLLTNLQGDEFIIQLAGLKNEALMKEFIKDNNMQNFIWIYRTQRYGGDWFVILYDQRFSKFSEANAAIASIPSFQGKEGIFIKRARDAIEEIEKVAP